MVIKQITICNLRSFGKLEKSGIPIEFNFKCVKLEYNSRDSLWEKDKLSFCENKPSSDNSSIYWTIIKVYLHLLDCAFPIFPARKLSIPLFIL